MGRVRFLSVLVLLALAPTFAFAYALGPGDRVTVEVRAAQTQLSAETVVSVDGRIYLAPAGTFAVEGKTPAEVEADIARELGNYYVGPVEVAVLVTEPKEVTVAVLGQVRQPGEHRLLDDRPLLSQAITKAQGLLPQASSRRVSLTRQGRELGPVDLHAILVLGRSDQDVALRPDDVIYVPARKQWATVIGPAEQPGIYELLPGDRLSDIIVMAGGLTAEADPQRAFVERAGDEGGSRTIEIDLHAALASPGGDADPPLAHGDTVRLVMRVAVVYVLGEVREPGAQDFADNRTLLDYIGLAGGTTNRATLHRAAIIRGTAPEPQIIPVDLAKLMEAPASGPPPPIEAGDIIFLPERSIATVQDWTSIGGVLAALFAGIRLY